MPKGRKLNLKVRAERMEETRERIARAAYELHRTVGPARTTVSAIAERAGVQRHTVYHHFPDELSLGGACTTYALDLDPQPDPTAFGRIADPEARLRAALAEQYGYYARNDSLLANTYRDAPLQEERLRATGARWEDVPEVIRGFFEQPAQLQESLVPGWHVPARRRPLLRAALALAIDFHTWRTLTRAQGLDQRQAIELMVRFVVCTVSEPASPDRKST